MTHRSSRKAQFATEFLMTYGWVLIIVGAIFTALYAFGIFDVQNILPEKCALTPGFACRDYALSSDQIIIDLTNGIGRTIVVDVMQGTHKELGTCVNAPSGDTTIPNGETEQLTLDCPINLPGRSKQQLTINFTYHFASDPSTSFFARGTLFARVP